MTHKHGHLGRRIAVAGAGIALLALSAQGVLAAGAHQHAAHQLALIQMEMALDPEAADELAPVAETLEAEADVFAAQGQAAEDPAASADPSGS